MENEKLNELLGEDLAKQVTEKLGDKKIFVGEGEFIPKSRFDEVNNQNKEYKTQLNEINEKLAKASGDAKSIEDLKEANKALQEQIKKNAEEAEAKALQMEKDYLINDSLKDAKAKNIKAVKGLLDLTNVKVENGKLTGLDEQIKALQQSDAYLFGEVSATPPNKVGAPPITPAQTQATTNPYANPKPWNAHKNNHF